MTRPSEERKDSDKNDTVTKGSRDSDSEDDHETRSKATRSPTSRLAKLHLARQRKKNDDSQNNAEKNATSEGGEKTKTKKEMKSTKGDTLKKKEANEHSESESEADEM